MNQYLKEAEEQRWQKREKQWGREQHAREELLKEVMTTREAQIREKDLAKSMENEREAQYARLAEEQYNIALEKEQKKEHEKRSVRKQKHK